MAVETLKPFDAKLAGFGPGTPGAADLEGLLPGTRFKFLEWGSVWVAHGGGRYGTGLRKDAPSHPSLGPTLVLVVGGPE